MLNPIQTYPAVSDEPQAHPSEHPFKIHNLDARKLDSIISDQLIDVTITSPPYFDMKDYGHKDQIGFGQSYQDYLEDLKIVFSKIYSATKDTGSLWVIIDTFKRDGKLIPLPFDFASKIQDCGWRLQDVIVWQKDRTLPWTKSGTTRNIFEYILVFSKQEKYKYFSDKVRDYQELKKWWVKYPERYNPKGKSLDEIWHFGIPTQGSWGNGYIKHFCPLPEELVDRILTLTTEENDVVLDPFSGSGTVPAQAMFRNRKFIGFELNKAYINMFDVYIAENFEKKKLQYSSDVTQKRGSSDFENLILDLRILKFARILLRELKKLKIHRVKTIFALRTNEPATLPNKLVKAKYLLLIDNSSSDISCDTLAENITQIITKAPLSKYGIQADIELVKNTNEFLDLLPQSKLYVYTHQCTHKYRYEIDADISSLSHQIISPIKVTLNEQDYD